MIELIQQIARESIDTKHAFFAAHAEAVARAAQMMIDSIKAGASS